MTRDRRRQRQRRRHRGVRRRRAPLGDGAAPAAQPRLRGRDQHRHPPRLEPLRARPQPRRRGRGRHAPGPARADGARPADRLRRPGALPGGRQLRPRRPPRLPDSAELARALHRHRPARRQRPARRLPRARGRERPGRCRQRRLHAAAAPGARAGRPLRRGVLDVHGGPRPQLAPRARRLDHLLRALGPRDPHQGRDDGRAPQPEARVGLPPRHGPLLPQALRRRSLGGVQRLHLRGNRRPAGAAAERPGRSVAEQRRRRAQLAQTAACSVTQTKSTRPAEAGQRRLSRETPLSQSAWSP